MQNVPHTPGPWYMSFGQVRTYDETKIIANADRNEPNTSPTERDANVRLMAAAPEMLDALKSALVVIFQHYPETETCCANRITQIKDAIRKAEYD